MKPGCLTLSQFYSSLVAVSVETLKCVSTLLVVYHYSARGHCSCSHTLYCSDGSGECWLSVFFHWLQKWSTIGDKWTVKTKSLREKKGTAQSKLKVCSTSSVALFQNEEAFLFTKEKPKHSSVLTQCLSTAYLYPLLLTSLTTYTTLLCPTTFHCKVLKEWISHTQFE